MTQARIRSVLTFFLFACIIVYVTVIFFMREGEDRALNRAYLVEMLRRAGYSTALFNWLPQPELLDQMNVAGLESVSPFSVSVLTEAESDVRGLTVSEKFPFIGYAYSEPLRRIVAIRETFAQRPTQGCPGATFLIGISITVLAVTLSVLFIKLANTLAATALAHPSRSRMLLARLCVFVAFLLPVGFGALLLHATSQMQYTCAVLGWQDDIRRTAMLIGELYGLLLQNFRLQIPRASLHVTLEAINAALIGDGDYSLHVIDYAAQSILPAVTDPAVAAGLLSVDASQQRYSAYLPESGVVIAAYEMSEQSFVLGVVKEVAHAQPTMASRASWLGIALAMVPLCVICVLGLVAFPYASLGRITGGEEHLGPWVWRSPAGWPTWKLLQAAALVGFTVFAMSYNGERLSFFGNVSNNLTLNLASIVRSSLDISTLGKMLLSNYGMMLHGLDWSAAYVDHVAGTTVEDKTEVNRFYQALFTALDATTYTPSSVAEKASERTVQKLPLLLNKEQTQAFLTAHMQRGEDVEYLEAFVTAFDVYTMYSILVADPEGLGKGSPLLSQMIARYAEELDSENGATVMGNAVKGTLKSMEAYAAVADAFARQTRTDRDISELYETDRGRAVVALEERAIKERQASLPTQLKYDILYTYIEPSYVGWPLAAIVVTALCLGLDYLYTAFLYGRSTSAHDAAAVKMVRAPGIPATAGTLPPSNDYTAPHSTLNVNHFRLWRSAWCGCVGTACVAFVCVLFTVLCLVASLQDVTVIVSRRTFEEQTALPTLELAKSAGMMHASTAAWMRAFLSRLDEDLVAAMQLTYSWAKVTETAWADAKPSTTDDRFDSELAHTASAAEALEVSEAGLRNNLRQMSNLVFAHLSARSTGNDMDSVYSDFISLLEQYDDYLPTLHLYTCTTGNATAFLDFTRILHNVALDLIYMYGDAYVDAYIEKLETLATANPTCNLRTERIGTFLRRCSLMRRRAAFFIPRKQLATTLTTSSDLATTDMVASVKASTGVLSQNTFSTVSAAWLPIVAAWLCFPVVVLLRRAAVTLHRSIYYS